MIRGRSNRGMGESLDGDGGKGYKAQWWRRQKTTGDGGDGRGGGGDSGGKMEGLKSEGGRQCGGEWFESCFHLRKIDRSKGRRQQRGCAIYGDEGGEIGNAGDVAEAGEAPPAAGGSHHGWGMSA